MQGEFFGLVECRACKGLGTKPGIFHRFSCEDCHGAGFALQGLEGLVDPQALTSVMGRALRLARSELARRPAPVTGAAADYQGRPGSRTGD